METKQETARTEEAQAVFDRVWKRVMEGSGEAACPITWNPPAEPSASQEEPKTDSAPILPAVPCPDRPHGDFPEESFCLGAGCLDTLPFLQELLRRVLGDCRYYQALARRTGGGAARTLNTVAMEKKKQAKRLSAACFLISGVKYWPEVGGKVSLESYLGSLRRRFMAEQRTMADCLSAAEGTGDPCLRELFCQLARESWVLACRLRGLVEQM